MEQVFLAKYSSHSLLFLYASLDIGEVGKEEKKINIFRDKRKMRKGAIKNG